MQGDNVIREDSPELPAACLSNCKPRRNNVADELAFWLMHKKNDVLTPPTVTVP